MRIVAFVHSLVSDWNHGNAHFLRGIASEWIRRGHQVSTYEPADGWSRSNLLHEHGEQALTAFSACYPGLQSTLYDPATLDLDDALHAADLVLVHEWNPPDLIERIGRHRRRLGRYRLYFHDTHHRSVSDTAFLPPLDGYDGVLAYGGILRDLYLENGWATAAWTWHEAADIHTFKPQTRRGAWGDLVWIGNWGDNERAAEIREFLIEPVVRLGLRARVYGVRYPDHALDELKLAGIEYGGWLPNFQVPYVFARYRATIHIPRRPYVTQLRGIPTIRPFEALACGIPLISAPWDDTEGLFRRDTDLLFASDGRHMADQLKRVLADDACASSLSQNGLETILSRHTCAHRADQLEQILTAQSEAEPVGGRAA